MMLVFSTCLRFYRPLYRQNLVRSLYSSSNVFSNHRKPFLVPSSCYRFQGTLLPCTSLPNIPASSSLRPYSSDARKQGDEEAKKKEDGKDEVAVDDDSKLSLWQQFKKMYREYWYVLVPVHLITSIGWFGSFYYVAVSGIDLAPYLQMIGLGEEWAHKLSESGAGYVAVAYALYKLATPARYTVTLAGTTLSIRYLKKMGWIRPVPTTKQLRQKFQDRSKDMRKKAD